VASINWAVIRTCLSALDLKRCAHSSCRGVEDGEHSVASHVHDAPTMSLDLLSEDGSIRFERGHGGLIVRLHQT
jgi:hypothetical protein